MHIDLIMCFKHCRWGLLVYLLYCAL